ncbi:unnamed protein product [Vicia faba]|uniref:Transcription factor CBF/NF-Y/archaeal histone domain-containing protein n=1 Tax=Vicia faba TaxID=3906 RepID=A0AAV1BBW3_VICFA|nr:unnamed protein product [Vicia faba]
MAGNKRSSQTSPVGSPTSGNISDSSSSKEQDRFLPIANVSRIMKRALPANAKISKEAKETVQECVSEFISFITGEASDKCQREKRKTINGDDLLWAMTTLGFENYVGPLKVYLNNYRETEGEKSNSSASSMVSTKQDDYYNHDHGSSNGGFYSQVVNDNGSKRFQEIVDYRVIGQSGGGGGDEVENAIASGNGIMPPNLRYRVEW